MTLGIYIHWPFCVSKCPYCDFNSHVQRSIDEDVWAQNIISEISYYYPKTKDLKLKSIFFGGGTPSLMSPKTVEAIINHIYSLWNDNIEITLEANPNSVEVLKFKDLKSAGVNRISIGVQSFIDEDLKFLGRQHSATDAKNALKIALETFDHVSFDLIYALHNQTLHAWEDQLKEALSYGTNHLSLYQLTIEPGTVFEKRYKSGDLKVTTEALAFYELTNEIMKQNDFNAYEVSNYAKQGFECQHNLIYWRYQPFIGVGPGAHGRLHVNDHIIATQNYKSPKKWLDACSKNGFGAETTIQITPHEQIEEKLLMGLRLLEPLQLSDKELEIIDIKKIDQLNEFISFKKESCIATLQVSEKGRLVLNSVLNKILK